MRAALSLTHVKIKKTLPIIGECLEGDDRIRTGDQAFAELCLATWPRRRRKSSIAEAFIADKAGLADACAAAQIKVRPEWIVETDEHNAPGRYHELLSAGDRPTGVVTYNDDRAIGVANVARGLSLDIPQDLSIVGFDNGPVARMYDTPLTSVDAECREIGTAAINLLIDKIDNLRARPALSIRIRAQSSA